MYGFQSLSGVKETSAPFLPVFLCKAEEFGGACREGWRGAQSERGTLYQSSVTFGHSPVVQPKDLLILLVYIKLSLGSKAMITYTVCFSFGDSLAQQSQPCCLSPRMCTQGLLPQRHDTSFVCQPRGEGPLEWLVSVPLLNA